MGAAIITNPEHGYTATGGTDETLVTQKRLFVKSLTFVPNGVSGKVTIKDGNSNAVVHTIKAEQEGNKHEYFGRLGKKFNGMRVTLSNASDILYINLD